MPVVRTRLFGWTPDDDDLSAQFVDATDSLQADSATNNSNNRRNIERDPSWVPRPRNAFIIFRCEYSREHSGVAAAATSTTPQSDGSPQLQQQQLQQPQHSDKTLSKRAAEAWKQLPPAERERYKDLANKEKEEHARLNPNYRFRPVKRQQPVRRNSRSAATSGSTVQQVPQWSLERRFSAPDVSRPRPPPQLLQPMSLPLDSKALKKSRRRSSSVPLPEPVQYQLPPPPPPPLPLPLTLQQPLPPSSSSLLAFRSMSLPGLPMASEARRKRSIVETYANNNRHSLYGAPEWDRMYYQHRERDDCFSSPPESMTTASSSPHSESALSTLMSAFRFGPSVQEQDLHFTDPHHPPPPPPHTAHPVPPQLTSHMYDHLQPPSAHSNLPYGDVNVSPPTMAPCAIWAPTPTTTTNYSLPLSLSDQHQNQNQHVNSNTDAQSGFYTGPPSYSTTPWNTDGNDNFINNNDHNADREHDPGLFSQQTHREHELESVGDGQQKWGQEYECAFGSEEIGDEQERHYHFPPNPGTGTPAGTGNGYAPAYESEYTDAGGQGLFAYPQQTGVDGMALGLQFDPAPESIGVGMGEGYFYGGGDGTTSAPLDAIQLEDASGGLAQGINDGFFSDTMYTI